MVIMDSKQRSYQSYHNNKVKVARRRILNAIDKGRCVLEKTLHDPKYQWNDAEKAMMVKCLQNRRDRYIKHPKDITFVRDYRFRRPYPSDNIKEYQQKQSEELKRLENKVKILEKDIKNIDDDNLQRILLNEIKDLKSKITNNPIKTRVSPIFTSDDDIPFSPPHRETTHEEENQHSSNEIIISTQDVIDTYTYLIENDFMYEGRSEFSKERGLKEYTRNINRLFSKLKDHNIKKTYNLLDLYLNPKLYEDITYNNKKYLQILYKLHTLSCKGKYPAYSIVPKSIINLCNKVDNIRFFTEQYSLITDKEKEREIERMNNSPYYDWEDIKKIPYLITGNSLQELKDKILIQIYTEENIVRDNLGLLQIVYTKPKHKVNFNYIYKTKNGNYNICLNDYKNVFMRGSYKIELSESISNLIDEYISKMEKKINSTKSHKFKKIPYTKKLEYLFTQENGEKYADGKLSRYILSMFKRYTGAVNLGINQLRHSVATYYKDRNDKFKAKLAYKMQHSLTQHKKYERVSSKVIKLPIFDKTKQKTQPFHNKKVTTLHKNKIVDGVIQYDDSNPRKTNKYKLVFDDESIKPKYYSEIDVYFMIENQEIMNNIGKRAIYVVHKHEIPMYGSKTLEGTIRFNKDYEYDENTHPYLFVFDDDRKKSIAFTLLDRNIKIL